MAALFWSGALALALGLALFFFGIGFVARDEILGWFGVVGGPLPMWLGVRLIRKPDAKPD